MAFDIQTVANTNEVVVTYSSYSNSSITLVNTHATADVTVDLYLKNTAGTIVCYFLNNVKIPNGASLRLDQEDVYFDNAAYTLYIDSDNSSGAIDIISRKT
jgi:hypothetical protein